MANGRSRYTLIRGGLALRSLSSRSMRSLSESTRILLDRFGWEVDPYDTARCTVVQQPLHLSFNEPAFNELGRQKKQPPLVAVQQPLARTDLLRQDERDVGECLLGQVHWGQVLLDASGHHAKVAERCEESLRDAPRSRIAPPTNGGTGAYLLLYEAKHLAQGDLYAAMLLQRRQQLSHYVVK